MNEFAKMSEQLLREKVINQLLEERTEIIRQISYPGMKVAMESNTEALIKLIGEVPQEA